MTNSDPNTLFEEQLKKLKLQYLQSFPEKIRELKLCCQGLEQGQEDQFAVLAANAHKLAGSAGSYGYPEISQHAMTLCDLLGQAIANGEIRQESTQTQIKLQTERLCTALSSHCNMADAAKSTVAKN